MLENIQKYHQSFKEMWNNCNTTFPELDRTYSRKEKLGKEAELDAFFISLKNGIKKDILQKSSDNEDLFEMMENFFRKGLDYTDQQLSVILSDDMANATKEFILQARSFDPEISLDDIFQACRNVWIMNGIQHVLGVKVSLTPSIFAYSMLYPYTDNFVDDPNISNQEKINFSDRFAKRLRGEHILPENNTEEKIHQLVEMIEEEWERSKYPGVYASLLGIHDAQTESMKLLSVDDLNEEEIFRICVNKGGTSVVADGYLILGNVNNDQEKFLYDYGAYLQLLDDLQDTSDDLNDGLMTCFSNHAKSGKLDEQMNRTFHLGFNIMDEVGLLNSVNTSDFKCLMKKSIDLFLIEAVITNRSFFNKRYVRKFEQYSPFRYSYIKKRSSTLSPYQKLLFRNIEEYALKRAGQDDIGLKITA